MPKNINQEETVVDAVYEEVEQNDGDLLKALLSVEDEVTKMVWMPRFGAHFKVRGVPADEYARLENRCKYMVKNKRTGRVEEKIDQDKLSLMLIQAGCMTPDWSDPKLLEKYKVTDPSEVIQKRLLMGEVDMLSTAIMDASGYFNGVETIKN